VVAGAAFSALLIATYAVLPEVFTDDDRVVERAHTMWPLLVAMMPFAGAVFALDGIAALFSERTRLLGLLDEEIIREKRT